MRKYFILCFYVLISIPAFSQFTGGSYDGFAFNNVACPVTPAIFLGGSYDGFSFYNVACPPSIYLGGGAFGGSAFGNVSCPPTIFSGGAYDGFSVGSVAPCVNNAPFLGGSYDGFSYYSIACPVPAIFVGGSYDGFSYNSTSCPVIPDIFTGGSYDGFSFINIACPVTPDIFIGGSYDGFSFINIACPVTPDIYIGGSYDGFSFINIACPVTSDIYIGGSYDGFSFGSIACAATIFSGGSYDGFAMGSIACAGPFIGGSYDGFSFNNVACSIPAIFVGGSYDGFAFNNAACPVVPAIFAGGSYDGFSFNNVACIVSPIYVGGSYDGFSSLYHSTTTPCGCTTLPLPIELLYFTAKPVNGYNSPKVLCNWATASETNNAYFTVEKTLDAFNFSDVGNIDGAGNSNTTLFYSMTDENPYIGQSYYRLKQTDFNGRYSYSELVSVFISNNQSPVFNIYPNPTTDIIQVIVSPQTQIAIFNFQGQLMKNFITIGDKTSIDVSAFPAGIYFIRVRIENGITVKKFIKE